MISVLLAPPMRFLRRGLFYLRDGPYNMEFEVTEEPADYPVCIPISF